MRFFKIFLLCLSLFVPLFLSTPALADDCSDTCSEDYYNCLPWCEGIEDPDELEACEAECETAWQECDEACTEADEVIAASAAAAAASTAAVETSETIEYKVVSQSSYFAELQSNGITFAYVGQKCQETGECTLEDIMQVFVNIANFILGIVGSLTLIITIYGGFLWLTSQGSSEKIQQGKTAMTGSVIGLLIVFGAFAGINLLTGVLRGGDAGQSNKCELVSPAAGGKAGTGYACIDTTGLDTTTEYTCETNLCPGGDEIKCCIKNDSTSN